VGSDGAGARKKVLASRELKIIDHIDEQQARVMGIRSTSVQIMSFSR
jgi:hypothetical protein